MAELAASRQDIFGLLADRHVKDVFVPECKDGPTWSSEHVRLDAWAMPRSWSHLIFYGYEVKVSRADFLQDEKWHKYLPLCHQLYFVTPAKLLEPSELPGDVGLLEATKGVTRLLRKKKATHREIQPPTWLLLYILMCRAHIGPDHSAANSREQRIAEWKRRLKEKSDGYEIARLVQGRIRKTIEDQETKNDRLQTKVQSLEHIGQKLEELGLNRKGSGWETVDKLERIAKGVRPEWDDLLGQAVNALYEVRTLLHQIGKEPKSE